jgi:hypothetical protein
VNGFGTDDCQKDPDLVYPAFCDYPGTTFNGSTDSHSFHVSTTSDLLFSFGPFNGGPVSRNAPVLSRSGHLNIRPGDRMDILVNVLEGTCDMFVDVSSSNGTDIFSRTATLDNVATSQPLVLPNTCQGCSISFRLGECTAKPTNESPNFAFGGLAFSFPGNVSTACESQVTSTSNWQMNPGQRKQQPTTICSEDGTVVPRSTKSDNSSIQLKFNAGAIAIVGDYEYIEEQRAEDRIPRYSIVREPLEIGL